MSDRICVDCKCHNCICSGWTTENTSAPDYAVRVAQQVELIKDLKNRLKIKHVVIQEQQTEIQKLKDKYEPVIPPLSGAV